MLYNPKKMNEEMELEYLSERQLENYMNLNPYYSKVVYLNLHPKGLAVGDCAKRAIALGLDKPYKEISLALNRHKKITGAKKYYLRNNIIDFLNSLPNLEKISFPAEKGKRRMTGNKFCEAYPKGRYILNMAHHLTCAVDGYIFDTWDCGKKCVYTAYKVENNEQN